MIIKRGEKCCKDSFYSKIQSKRVEVDVLYQRRGCLLRREIIARVRIGLVEIRCSKRDFRATLNQDSNQDRIDRN